MAKAPFIEDARLKHLLKVAGISGESPVRNIALLYTIYGTGMMLTEVARLLYWSSPRVTSAIDKYLEYRVEHKHGITTRKVAYRGLDPDSALFRASEGEPYRLTTRKTTSGALSYSCDSLSQLFRKLHLQAGIESASAMSGRRTFAIRLHQKGYDLRHINELLGHETLTATKNLIDADPVLLGALVAGII